MSTITLPLGGVAIAGRSGSGKSSMFFGSDHVRHVFIADTGSQGHKLFQKPGGEARTVEFASSAFPSVQVMNAVQQWSKEGKLWVVDSFTTLIEHECVFMKRGKRGLSQQDYKDIVGRMRDLALVLAQLPGFTVLNTASGGVVKLPDGTLQNTPQGSIVGLPSLTGVGPGSETILARWSTVYVVFPGHTFRDQEQRMTRHVPRGFLLPNKDLRPAEMSQYTPIKDSYGLLSETVVRADDGDRGLEVDAFPALTERPMVDVMLERLAAKYPMARVGGVAEAEVKEPIIRPARPTRAA